ncbi:MAG: ribbon-helix-helix protein, CopG family [Deltaproteobacteria bacterium]|nr:ribbon-helix-helix protein, CopG family [Deltaproteobacteria bacterium]
MITIDFNNERGEQNIMQLTIRMPDEYKEKIELLSGHMGIKKSDIARLALRKFIDENLELDQKTPYQKVKHLLGRAESGITDLGQNHRKHIIDQIKKGSK